jgi:DNA polymerase-3 subunit alpha
VKLEDGTTRQFHRAEHFKCADGKLRTIEEAMHDGADVLGI